MPNLLAIRAQLSTIHSQLLQMPVFSTGRPDSDDRADKQAARLEKIGEQLQLILRDLKNSDHLARLQLENIRKVPLQQRWSAKQSAEQQGRDVAAVAAEAEVLAGLARDLLKRNGLISPTQAAKKTIDLIEDLQKHLPSHLKVGTQQPLNYPVYTSPRNDAGSPHVESVVPLVTLLYVAIKYWKEKCSSKDARSV